MPFEYVFVATDFSAGVAQAIARAGRVPQTERGKVTVVHVLSDGIPKKLAQKQLEQATRSVRAATAGRLWTCIWRTHADQ